MYGNGWHRVTKSDTLIEVEVRQIGRVDRSRFSRVPRSPAGIETDLERILGHLGPGKHRRDHLLIRSIRSFISATSAI